MNETFIGKLIFNVVIEYQFLNSILEKGIKKSDTYLVNCCLVVWINFHCIVKGMKFDEKYEISCLIS